MPRSIASLCLMGSLMLGGVLTAGEALASASPSFVLVPPPGAVAGDSEFAVALYVNNETDAPVTFQVSRELAVLVETEAASRRTVLETASPERTGAIHLRPQEFRRIEYRGRLASVESGVAAMELLDLPANRVMFATVADEAAAAPVAAPAPEAAPPEDDESPGSAKALFDSLVGGLSTYEPMYFIVGGGEGDDITARFQLSAQYRIFRPVAGDAERSGLGGHILRFLDDIYASYTQTAVWDLSSPSAPFVDTSFRPSLYYFHDDLIGPRGFLRRLGLQAGLEHESNGKSGAFSRSINILFARPIFTFGDPDEYHWTVAPKIYAYLEKEDNSDIDDYRGYVDLLVKFGKIDGLELSATLRKGVRSTFGSAQVDATYPIARVLPRLGAFLHLQYFYGYGETLLHYNENVGSQVRAGLMLVPYGGFFP